MELTKELAEAAARRFIDSGAKNYAGDVYTITRDDGGDSFEVVVTIQKVGAEIVVHDVQRMGVVTLPPKVPVVAPKSINDVDQEYLVGSSYNLAIDNCRKQIEAAGGTVK